MDEHNGSIQRMKPFRKEEKVHASVYQINLGKPSLGKGIETIYMLA